MAFLLVIILLVLFFMNVPVFIGIGLATLAVVTLSGDIQLIKLPQSMFSSLDSITLMAIPFFVLAGKLMEFGGISERLIDLAKSFVGHYRGGLAHVSIMASIFFAAISGSAIATTVAIGSIMIPSMVKLGYDRNFAAALHASAGNIGGIIPPSIPMVLYAVAGGVSVGQMFIAGIIPGLLIGVSFMFLSYFIARKEGYETTEKRGYGDLIVTFRKSILALLMPVIILGGIYGGIFTPTEAAAVAVAYGFIVGTFVYKEINLSILRKILISTVLTTSSLCLIIATASFFGMFLILDRVPQNLAAAIESANLGPVAAMLLINLLLLLLGTFMDAAAALIITTPILLPVAVNLGFDPIHFGIILIVNLSIGVLTPPLGVNLFVASKVANTTFEGAVRKVIPFILIMIVDLILIIFLPQISSGFAELMFN
ncbi:TRAP transporter large permease [Siminovitchia sediminis]|uniref:TRAP transporter large permease n=1 Tax=Siminovitchia sediminis TaxID=1274353 RepID=A0ABW4KM27_9BACI